MQPFSTRRKNRLTIITDMDLPSDLYTGLNAELFSAHDSGGVKDWLMKSVMLLLQILIS